MTQSSARFSFRLSALPVAVMCLAPVLAQAQIGPVGPIGPVGATGTDAPGGGRERAAPATPAAPAAASTRAAPVQPVQPVKPVTGQRNRIEVTGNTATHTGCGPGGASVNSIQVDRQSLEGQTVIVQGRNSSDVDVRPCPAAGHGSEAAPAVSPGTQVNSIRVR